MNLHCLLIYYIIYKTFQTYRIQYWVVCYPQYIQDTVSIKRHEHLMSVFFKFNLPRFHPLFINDQQDKTSLLTNGNAIAV